MHLLYLLSFTGLFSFLFHTQDINRMKKEARRYYMEKQYLEAIKLYNSLEKEYKVDDPRMVYDHANACYRSLQLGQAYKLYQTLAENDDSVLAAMALNQMGIISCRTNKLKDGKTLFMEALRRNPGNRHAVLNLEWALTLKEQQQEQNRRKRQQQKKQESNDQRTEDDKTDFDGSDKEKEALRSSTHKNRYMDLRTARLLMESMKRSEQQYIQQLPVNNTPNSKEPAW